MNAEIKDVIAKLEKQVETIQTAITALRQLDGVNAANGASPRTAKARKAARAGGISDAGRKRLSEAMKARWAAKKASTKKRGRPAA